MWLVEIERGCFEAKMNRKVRAKTKIDSVVNRVRKGRCAVKLESFCPPQDVLSCRYQGHEDVRDNKCQDCDHYSHV